LVSSLKSDGIDNLLSLIDAKLSKNHQTIQCQLDLSEGKTLSWIYDNMQVISIKQSEQNYNMTLKGTAENLAKLLQKGGIKKLIKVSKISN
jgi:50S ribosomal subunit-associated GTPase HflX